MAESQQSVGAQRSTQRQGADTAAATELRVEFVIKTYTDLHPFIEMAVILLEGVYEHKRTLTLASTEK